MEVQPVHILAIWMVRVNTKLTSPMVHGEMEVVSTQFLQIIAWMEFAAKDIPKIVVNVRTYVMARLEN